MSELPSLRELLGDEGALIVVERLAGTRVFVPEFITAEHPLRETLGEKVFGDLVRYFGKSMILVPLARHWRVEIYASQNMTHAQIARKLGCGETMVYRALKKLRAERDQMVLNF